MGDRWLHPLPRAIDRTAAAADGMAAATQGLREVLASRYLLLIVGVVVCYEFAAAMTDFVVNVVFERAFSSEVQLAQMFGRLGWIVSLTALVSQMLLVPVILPAKRAALLIPPVAMALATIGLSIVPIVGMAILLSAADRGLNYSLQQATKETLYVPLTDGQKYKGKAVIDMFVDRLGKALSAIALIAVVALSGVSIPILLTVALGAILIWVFCANQLGRAYARRAARPVRNAA
jgi:AAA family ATP:ADP antiporter